MLIPNGITSNTAINYELTGYINDINTEYTQVLTEFGANGSTTNIYEYGEQRNSATSKNVTTVTVSKGTTIYEGVAASQTINGGAGQLLGGGNQFMFRRLIHHG